MGWFDKQEEIVQRSIDQNRAQRQRFEENAAQQRQQNVTNFANNFKEFGGGLMTGLEVARQRKAEEAKRQAAENIFSGSASNVDKSLNPNLGLTYDQIQDQKQKELAKQKQEAERIKFENLGMNYNPGDPIPQGMNDFQASSWNAGRLKSVKTRGGINYDTWENVLTGYRDTTYHYDPNDPKNRKDKQFSYSDELSYQENEKVAEWLDAMGIEDVSRLIRREGSRNFFTKEGKESYLKYFGQKHVKNILDKQLPTLPTSPNVDVTNGGLFSGLLQMNQTPNIFNNGLPPIGLNDFSQDGEESYGKKQAISKFNPKIFNYRRQQ